MTIQVSVDSGPRNQLYRINPVAGAAGFFVVLISQQHDRAEFTHEFDMELALTIGRCPPLEHVRFNPVHILLP